MPPGITRLFKGPMNEFKVEIVFAKVGDVSPKEDNPFKEIIVVTDGAIKLERSDDDEIHHFAATAFVELPAGIVHQISAAMTPTKLVVIHPSHAQ